MSPASRLRVARIATLAGWILLTAVLFNWFTWLDPPERVPRALLLIALVLPLFLPLYGLLHRRRRAHQWASFLALFYFAIGVDVAYNQIATARWLGLATIATSLLLFTGAIFVSKYLGPPRRSKRAA